jgi:Ser/Thr protein kinase RdoA (MazF antagonist)
VSPAPLSLAADTLAAWGGAAGPPRLVSDRENTVFEARLADGTRAALRLHRAGYRDAGAIEAELAWTGRLAAAGFPCPAPLPCRNGHLLARAPDGRHASLVTWIDGAPLSDSPEDDLPALYRRLGALVAELHAAGDRFAPVPAAFPRWDAEALLGEAPLWGRFWQNPALSRDEADLLHAARRAARDRLEAAEAPDIGLIHADLLADNVLDDGARLWIIDFDDCGLGHRAYDLATALVSHCGRPGYPELFAALVTGYASRRGSAARLTAELPLFVMLRAMASCGWIAGRAAPDDPRQRAYAERALRLAERWMARSARTTAT